MGATINDKASIYLSILPYVDHTFMDSLYSYDIHDSIDKQPEALIVNLGLSNRATGYALALLEVIDAGSGMSNYFSIKASIISLETMIISDNSISPTEKQALLAGTSVARYSFLYIIRETNDLNAGNNTNPLEITNPVPNTQSSNLSMEDTKRIAKADAEGAIKYTIVYGFIFASTGAAVFSAYEMHIMGILN